MVFEYRSYDAQPGRLDDLDKRFKDLAWPVMEKHGFQQVGFWIPEDSNNLVYMLRWTDRADAETKWRAFQQDPDWRTGKTASEANGPLLVKTSSTFLNATSYSETK